MTLAWKRFRRQGGRLPVNNNRSQQKQIGAVDFTPVSDFEPLRNLFARRWNSCGDLLV